MTDAGIRHCARFNGSIPGRAQNSAAVIEHPSLSCQDTEPAAGVRGQQSETADSWCEWCFCLPRSVTGTAAQLSCAGKPTASVAPARETPITGPDRLSAVVSQGVPPRGDVPIRRHRLPYLRAIGGASVGGIRQRQNKSEGDQDSGADGRSRRSMLLSGPSGRAHGNLPFQGFVAKSPAGRFCSGGILKIGAAYRAMDCQPFRNSWHHPSPVCWKRDRASEQAWYPDRPEDAVSRWSNEAAGVHCISWGSGDRVAACCRCPAGAPRCSPAPTRSLNELESHAVGRCCISPDPGHGVRLEQRAGASEPLP